MKQCYICKKEKDISEFSINKGRPDGHNAQCRDCHKTLRRNHYLRNKNKIIEQVAVRNKEHRKWFNSLKDEPCSDCGVRYPYYVMDFDHKENKEFNLSNVGHGKQKILQEMEKCDIVCSNCHRERTHKRRIKKACLL